MFGWRAKVGLIVPSTNTASEPEFWRFAPPGVSIHGARMHGDNTRPPLERLASMAPYARQAVIDLASAEVDVIVYGCTSGSFFRGRAWDLEYSEELAAIGGRPVVTTARASVEAMNALGVKTVCLATPYTDRVNAKLLPYLEEHGIKVLSVRGLQLTSALDSARVTPEQIFQLVREAWNPEADGLFFPCTGVVMAELIATLEEDLGKPVLSANQVSFWAAMNRCGVQPRIKAFGRLFES